MKRYFKRQAESEFGEGVVLLEIADDWPTRQVEVYGDTWRWADEINNEWLADQPNSILGLGDDDEIEKDEFELVWEQARAKCQSDS